MSADEKRAGAEPVIEQKTRVKVTRNAKGDPQWEITVVEGTPDAELERVRSLAVQTHRALVRELVNGEEISGAGAGDPEPGPAS